MKIVLVEWWDSCSQGANWIHRADAKNLCPSHCVTMGIVLNETPDFITLAGSNSTPNFNVSDVTSIPHGCIKKIYKLGIK